MPSGIHEIFLSFVTDEISAQLHLIRFQQGQPADFAREIASLRSITVNFDDPYYGPHDPDSSFGHSRAIYPGVVIEVSYTQRRKDLRRLADDYILGSSGSIRVLVGLDIEYDGRSATLSIWRSQLVTTAGRTVLRAEQTVTDEVCSAIFAPYMLTMIRYSAIIVAVRIPN
jgi:hypothetical protein